MLFLSASPHSTASITEHEQSCPRSAAPFSTTRNLEKCARAAPNFPPTHRLQHTHNLQLHHNCPTACPTPSHCSRTAHASNSNESATDALAAAASPPHRIAALSKPHRCKSQSHYTTAPTVLLQSSGCIARSRRSRVTVGSHEIRISYCCSAKPLVSCVRTCPNHSPVSCLAGCILRVDSLHGTTQAPRP